MSDPRDHLAVITGVPGQAPDARFSWPPMSGPGAYLTADPHWRGALPAADDKFTLADLLAFSDAPPCRSPAHRPHNVRSGKVSRP